MGISKQPSCVSLPCMTKPYPDILDFLVQRFPNIGRTVWEQRIKDGKVLDAAGTPINIETPYRPQKKLLYFREVPDESPIPLREKVLFQNDEILVADKPPFLPVIPSGPYIEECLLNRLKQQAGNRDLVPIHRIDRETSGIVLFSRNPETRGLYASLFANNQIEKSYEALAGVNGQPENKEWLVENRLEEAEPWFRMQVVAGAVNARSRIKLLDIKNNHAHFKLSPITGKKHQLRIHMSELGFRILNDRYYPELLPKQADDLENPLQLIARRLKFIDPVFRSELEFESERKLLF